MVASYFSAFSRRSCSPIALISMPSTVICPSWRSHRHDTSESEWSFWVIFLIFHHLEFHQPKERGQEGGLATACAVRCSVSRLRSLQCQYYWHRPVRPTIPTLWPACAVKNPSLISACTLYDSPLMTSYPVSVCPSPWCPLRCHPGPKHRSIQWVKGLQLEDLAMGRPSRYRIFT